MIGKTGDNGTFHSGEKGTKKIGVDTGTGLLVMRVWGWFPTIYRGARKNCYDMAPAIPCPHEAVIIKCEEGKERKMTIHYNCLSVRLPKYRYPLFLVVAKGFGRSR
jgi:hypothetical protein